MADDILEQGTERDSRAGGWGRSALLVACGVLAGAVVAGTVVAGATSDDSRDGVSASSDDRRDGDGRHDEQPLTGETADRVSDVALAEYPGATIRRLETDSDGVYEAHLVTAEGTRVTVEVGADFRITGVEQRNR
jgi:uncharacterized membrane protein YkoI